MKNKKNTNTLGYYAHIYRMILAQDLKSKMNYRADFIISNVGIIATNISGFVAFWIMFQNFPTILGWTYYEMMFLYGFSLIALTPVQLFFDNNWNLRYQVYSGDFIRYCFRPLNLFFYYISEVFDIKGIGQFAFGTGTLIYAWNNLGLSVSPLIILKLAIALFSASLFMIAIMNIAAATCFWITNSGVAMLFIFKFKDYARYPITIFNPVFKFIFTFIIPIAFIAYYPSLVFLRPDSIPLLTYLSPVIGVVFFYIGYKVWIIGAMRYSGTGS